MAELLVAVGGDGFRGGRARGRRLWDRNGHDGSRCLHGDHPHPQPGRVEAAEGLVEGHGLGQLRVIGEERHHLGVVGEHVFHEAVERLLRPHLHEHADPGRAEGLETLHELHRRGHLPAEDLEDAVARSRPHRVELARHVGDHRHPRGLDPQPFQDPAQRLAGGGHDSRVEGVAHRQGDRVDAVGQEGLDRRVHRGRGPADHRLGAAVVVGHDHVAVERGELLLDHREGGEHGGHLPVVVDGDAGHLAAAGAHRLQGVREGEDGRRLERAVLAQAVAHHHVGLDAVGAEEPGERRVHRQDRGLGDRGLLQAFLGLLDRSRIVGGDEEVVGERTAEQGCHHPVGFGEGVAHDGLGLAQPPQHVHVLRALAGVEERHLARGPAAPEDSLCAQGLPGRGTLGRERLAGLARLLFEVPCGLVVDGDALGSPQIGLEGRGRRRSAAGRGVLLDRLEPRGRARPRRARRGRGRPAGAASVTRRHRAIPLDPPSGKESRFPPLRPRPPVPGRSPSTGPARIPRGPRGSWSPRSQRRSRPLGGPRPPGTAIPGARCSRRTGSARSRCRGWGRGSSGWGAGPSRAARTSSSTGLPLPPLPSGVRCWT